MSVTECTSSSKESVSSECSTTTTSSGLGPTGKRLDYITWHQHHMYMARMLSEMSKEQEPNGCYIVDQEHYQIASGFSGETETEDGLCRCAIISAFHKLEKKAANGENLTMYLTMFPNCDDCLSRIPKMKVSKIWYWSSQNHEIHDDAISTLRKNGIHCEKYEPTRTISIDFGE